MTPAPVERARAAVARAQLTHLSVGVVDWHGRLRVKQVHADHLDKLFTEGTAFTTAIFATDSAEQPMANGVFQDPANGYRDAQVVFDDGSVFADPLYTGGAGLLLLGQLAEPFAAVCPRATLARECARLASLGCVAHCAFEIEGHILSETADALNHKVPRDLVAHPGFGRMYSFVDHANSEGLLDDLRRNLAVMEVPLDSLHIEFKGLLEAGLAPSPGVMAADRLVLYKAVVKAIANRHGALATFMAQLSNQHEPAGGHLNLSLRDRDSGVPLFHAAAESTRVSAACRAFVAGVQRHLPEFFVLCAPYINSYKRLGDVPFIPRRNTWALDDKTAAQRVVVAGLDLTRIELRIPGADVHPHLALAATLAAGRRGLEERLEPTAPATGAAAEDGGGEAGPAFPRDLRAAVEAWRQSSFVREIFGDTFVEAFALSRDWQLAQFERAVTDWELRQYGECV